MVFGDQTKVFLGKTGFGQKNQVFAKEDGNGFGPKNLFFLEKHGWGLKNQLSPPTR